MHVGSVQDCRRVPFQSWAAMRGACFIGQGGRRRRRPPPTRRPPHRRSGGRRGRRIADAAAAAEAVGHRRARSIGLQQHRLVPRSTRFPRAMAVAGSCPSGAQAVREVDLLRAAQSGAMCGGDQLVRTAAADWSARCPAATPVPNHAAWQARRSHVDRRLGAPQRWTISCALTALSSQGAAACPSADFGHLHC